MGNIQRSSRRIDLTFFRDESSTVDLNDVKSSSQQKISSSSYNPIPSEPQREVLTPSQLSTCNSTDTSACDDDRPSPSVFKLACPVCLESLQELLEKGSEIRSTICGHIFCRTCIVRAIKSRKKCPTCRKKISEKQTHPLYLPFM